jgi:Rhodopirellula transposase DDE domain
VVSHAVVVQLMGATRTRAGLTVNTKLDKRQYPTNVKVTTEEMASVNLEPNAFHGGMELHLQQTESSEHEKLNVVPIIA